MPADQPAAAVVASIDQNAVQPHNMSTCVNLTTTVKTCVKYVYAWNEMYENTGQFISGPSISFSYTGQSHILYLLILFTVCVDILLWHQVCRLSGRWEILPEIPNWNSDTNGSPIAFLLQVGSWIFPRSEYNWRQHMFPMSKRYCGKCRKSWAGIDVDEAGKWVQ